MYTCLKSARSCKEVAKLNTDGPWTTTISSSPFCTPCESGSASMVGLKNIMGWSLCVLGKMAPDDSAFPSLFPLKFALAAWLFLFVFGIKHCTLYFTCFYWCVHTTHLTRFFFSFFFFFRWVLTRACCITMAIPPMLMEQGLASERLVW